MRVLQNFNDHVSRIYSPTLMLVSLFLAVFFLWLFNLSSVEFSNPSLLSLTGFGLLDLLPFYSGQEVLNVFDMYGEEGRERYFIFQLLDFVFVSTYVLALLLVVYRLARGVSDSRWSVFFILLPLLIGLFDLIENSLLMAQLKMYPTSMVLVGDIAGVATCAKHVLTMLIVLVIVLLGLNKILSKRKQLPV